jgi:PHD/YefM family antitoxin component YafN of YafNO toxin-antitoxin module
MAMVGAGAEGQRLAPIVTLGRRTACDKSVRRHRRLGIENRNRPAAYLIPAVEWEAICDRLEDIELAEIVRSRSGETAVSVKLEDL